jgi:chromosome segregation ATPase
MSRAVLTILGLVLLLAVPAAAQEQKEDSVAEAARKAREKKKQVPKATKVFTNDNMPASSGSVSVIGAVTAPTPEGGEKTAKTSAAGDAEKEGPSEEVTWRRRFAEIRTKIRQAEKEIDILQREFNLVQQQYYSDPNQALREQLERKEIGERRKKIEDKQAEIKQLQQQLVDLEEELRKAGGPAGWARES